MSKSLIQTANQSTQVIAENSIIGLGSVQRRYGCNLKLSGNGIEVDGAGYYEIDADVTLTPNSIASATVALYKNGVQIPGAVATGSVSTAGNSVTLPLTATIRQGCECDGASNITVVLVSGASTVNNISVRVVKS
jgi:hypothetical protein